MSSFIDLRTHKECFFTFLINALLLNLALESPKGHFAWGGPDEMTVIGPGLSIEPK
jgi:hypothetical protein